MRFRRKKTVKAREFVLEDGEGNERAALRIDGQQNTVLQFKDHRGNVRMLLEIKADGTPRIALEYADGKGSIQLEANDVLNSAGILIAGPNGKVRVILGIAQTGEPAIGVLDEDGQILFRQAGSCAENDIAMGFDWDHLLRE